MARSSFPLAGLGIWLPPGSIDVICSLPTTCFVGWLRSSCPAELSPPETSLPALTLCSWPLESCSHAFNKGLLGGKWVFAFQNIYICNGTSYLVPETASPVYKLTTLKHLMGSKKRLLFGDMHMKPPTQSPGSVKLVLTCFVIGVHRDANTSQKPTSKHWKFVKSWTGFLSLLLTPSDESSCSFLFSSEVFVSWIFFLY